MRISVSLKFNRCNVFLYIRQSSTVNLVNDNAGIGMKHGRWGAVEREGGSSGKGALGSKALFDALAGFGGQEHRLVHSGFLQSWITCDITQALHLPVVSTAKSAHGQMDQDHQALVTRHATIHRLANPYGSFFAAEHQLCHQELSDTDLSNQLISRQRRR